MSVFVTGDTHGKIDLDKLVWFSLAHPTLTKADYVIIAGDFGGVWGEDTEGTLDRYSKLPMSILFVDGNHENFERLNAYPVEIWNGGKIHRLRDDVIHLMRGQIFTINGKTLFTLGGAESTDKEWREEGVSWWPAEVPTVAEIREGKKNLDKVGWSVDYVISHSASANWLYAMPIPLYRRAPRKENVILAAFEEQLHYGKWYFGHYHKNFNINNQVTLLYQQVIPLGASAEQRE